MKLLVDLTKARIPQLKQFIASHYRPDYILLDDTHFAWQFVKPPDNPFPYAMKLLELRREILGHIGILPVSFNCLGRNVLAGFLLNLMLDEKCRGFGLGARIIDQASEVFPMTYTTGYNAQTQGLYERLGNWTSLPDLGRFLKILNPSKVSELAQKRITIPQTIERTPSPHRVVDTRECDGRYDAFWERIRSKYPITVNRTAAYLAWRYLQHLLFNYNIIVCQEGRTIRGLLVYRLQEIQEQTQRFLVCHLVDFISEDEVEESLLHELVRRMRQKQADLVDFHFSGPFHLEALQAQGFVEDTADDYSRIPRLFNPIDRKKLYPINATVHFSQYGRQKEALTDARHWYLTRGDGDQDRPN